MGLILGVDPGATGALMLIDTANRRILAGLDMPTVRHGSWTIVDGAAALAWVQAQQIDRIVVERADCMPADGKAAAVQFGRVVGGITSVLLASGRPLELAAPSAWTSSKLWPFSNRMPVRLIAAACCSSLRETRRYGPGPVRRCLSRIVAARVKS